MQFQTTIQTLLLVSVAACRYAPQPSPRFLPSIIPNSTADELAEDSNRSANAGLSSARIAFRSESAQREPSWFPAFELLSQDPEAPSSSEEVWRDPSFFIAEHRRNYFAYSYNSSENDATDPNGIEPSEIIFQLSIRRDLLPNALSKWFGWLGVEADNRAALAYTNRSFWQITANSAPFRTTDHEIEGFIELDHLPQYTQRWGYTHQSNGEDGALSRSWDRVYAEAIWHSESWFDHGPPPEEPTWSVALKPWYIIKEGSKNGSIDHYAGYGELRGDYAWGSRTGRPRIGLIVRNNLKVDGNRGSVDASFSYGVREGVRVFVQYFNGYTESLLDFDDSSNRIAVGLEIGRAR